MLVRRLVPHIYATGRSWAASWALAQVVVEVACMQRWWSMASQIGVVERQ